MARDAPPSHSLRGLYAAVLAREEAEAQHSYPHPSNRPRLVALRAGEPADVTAGELPPWARVGEAVHWWRRATVTATGAVTFYNDDASRWLAESGL